MARCSLALLILVISPSFSLSISSPKVHRNLTHIFKNEQESNVVVSFTADTSPVLESINSLKFSSRGAKIASLKESLEILQMKTQKNAREILSNHSFKYHSLWINNQLYIKRATKEIVNSLAALPEVKEIREEVVAKIEVVQLQHDSFRRVAEGIEWGIKKVEADKAWALNPGGNNGTGVVVATVDSGVRASHASLRGNRRPTHDWFDPYKGTEEPNDPNGHGTHVTGTAVGQGGIGVAPGAQWIHCVGCDAGLSCWETELSLCAQWILCPTLRNGSFANCDMAPHVVSNSYGAHRYRDFFRGIVDAWQTAGIIPVFAIGNTGPMCYTTLAPGDYPNVIGVGATDENDLIAQFSARGPDAISGKYKPDISAPGYVVGSASNLGDNEYRNMCGTSMATPHVAGVVALILSKKGNMTVWEVMDKLNSNADREGLGYSETCVGPPSYGFPNNIYGYGRLNARRSLNATNNF